MAKMDSGAEGPLLSDQEFFGSALLQDAPDMKPAIEAAGKGDYSAARRLFAAAVRKSLRPETFFSIPYEVSENAYQWPEESDLEAADRICRNELISCGTAHAFGDKIDWFANPTFNAYKEWTWQLSRHNEWKLLARAYQDTGDEKYAQCFARHFASWVKQAIVPGDDVPGNETLCWRTIECGIRMGANWPYTFYTFFNTPSFTDALLVDWYKSVWEHGKRLRLQRRTGNWLIMEMNGLAQIGILYPQFAQAKEWYDYALKKLIEELDKQIYPDGFQFELSTNYHFVVINNYHRLIRVMKAYGSKIPPEFIQKLEPMAELMVKLMKPEGRLPDINDGGKFYVSDLLETLISLFPENPIFRWAVSGGKEGSKPGYTSVALPWSGFLLMRSGWDKDAVWGLFDAAPFGTGHQHEDKLNLLIQAGDHPLLTEGGNYAYDESEMRRYVLSTRSHNTMRVDQQDQNRLGAYRWHDGDIALDSGMKYRIEEAFDSAEGEYNEGYGPDADKSVTHRRRILFLKKPPAGFSPFFIVVDRFLSEGNKPHYYEILWHLNEDLVELSLARTASRHISLIHSGPPEGMTLLRGREYPEWQGWIPGGSGKQRDYKPLHTLLHTVHAGNFRLLTLLYPGDTCPVSALEGGVDPENTDILIRHNAGELRLNEDDYI
ncbi:heparinase [Spirochaetia bacterium]|nr:heparinase [Spirochaetia bacterium]GHV86751.1 heparinase [Spirochaetia bacterium]